MLKSQFLDLHQIMKFEYPIYAHWRNGYPAETLVAHTQLCQYYFEKIYQERNAYSFFSKFCDIFSVTEDSQSERLFDEMLRNVITFHDIGKVNPEFQRINMHNPVDKSYRVNWLSGTKHSLFSAYIYVNHFMMKIEALEIDKRIKANLWGICLINGMVISRHHSDLSDMQDFINEFKGGGSAEYIEEGLKETELFLTDQPDKKRFKYPQRWLSFCKKLDEKMDIGIYIYSRNIYSLLVSCDYYATTEYMNGYRSEDFGTLTENCKFRERYEQTDLIKGIRENKKQVGINVLRTQMFLEAEQVLMDNLEADVYFLEAPTGSGKSNIAMNLSFQLLDQGYQKIYYVYPFNTLVEQNLSTLIRVFGENSVEFNQIVVLNSNTPIKIEKNKKDHNEILEDDYLKALLDRQFLNYPFVLTTHVTLFQVMFGFEREAIFGFSQLQDSIIILDEIQSYKNTIWSEIIIFLKTFAEYLNIKIIIMSATLPNLSYLTGQNDEAVYLLKNTERYFEHSVFKNRVDISYDLLEQEISLVELKEHLLSFINDGKKIVFEFIKKTRAYEFTNMLIEDERITLPVYLISGDDNRADRQRKITVVKEQQEGLILVATQVIEAGVDIDMDIGYKDISKLDSEEQFLGRINRSSLRSGMVYFFDLDDARKIYSDGDFRMNKDLTLINPEMKQMLSSKKFSTYYLSVMEHLKKSKNESLNTDENLSDFFQTKLANLIFIK